MWKVPVNYVKIVTNEFIIPNKMNKSDFNPGYFVDNVWHCGCGSWNSPTLEICPECNITKQQFIELEREKYKL